jgi:hypothetical protein
VIDRHSFRYYTVHRSYLKIELQSQYRTTIPPYCTKHASMITATYATYLVLWYVHNVD